MTDYTNLLERLAVSAGDQECLYADAKAAIEALQTRVAEAEDTNKALRVRLGSELERANELVADLQAECSELRGMAGAMDILRSEMIDSGVIDINVPPMFFSESIIPRLLRLADMEKQEPVAWCIDGEDGREYNGTPKMSGGRIGTPLYAAPPVITQHEPVTTVEDRYNADGKSCHITDDLPAGMKLYARPVHAEPVNARLLRLIKKARITIFDGLETPCELEHPASIDDRMLVTEIDSAIADAEAQQAGPVRLTEKDQDNLSIPYVGMGGVENYRAYARAIETFVLRANGFKVEGEK